MTTTMLAPGSHPAPHLPAAGSPAPAGHPPAPPDPPLERGRGAAPMMLPALLGALAVLSGTTSLVPLLDGNSWMLPLVEVVGVIYLIGVGGRLLGFWPWAVGLLQAAGMIVALTGLFTTGGIGGVLPNAAAAREAGALISGAWTQILSTVPPAPSTAELSFLIALTVGTATLIVDVLITVVRSPALVALPLLSLYSVPASIATTMLPWVSFVAPAALYMLLLAVTGHSGWRAGRRAGAALAINGTAIAAVSIVAALLLTNLATGIGTTGRLPRSGIAGGDVGLSPFAALKGELQRSAPVDMLRVSGLHHPDYLRTVALQKWTADQGFSAGPLADTASNVDGPLPGAPAPQGPTEQVTVTSLAFRDTFLPIFARTYTTTGLAPGWSYDANLQTVHRTNRVTPAQYTLSAAFPTLTAADLEQDDVISGGPLTATGPLPQQVVLTAQSITSAAQTPFDAAMALQNYFTDPANGFQYSLSVPTGNTGSALLDFLTNKQGFCEQYAAAMAIMLRAIGIPAQVAIGFTQGVKQSNGDYLVNSNDAHAWVEVLFVNAGWVRFDPTPVVDGQGGQQGFEAPAAGAPGGTAAATATTSAAATSASLQAGTAPKGQKIDGGGPGYQNGSTGAIATQAGAPWLVMAMWVLGALALLAVILGAPSLLRSTRRRRRMRIASSGRHGAASAAWSEIEDTLTDHGVVLNPSDSARATANKVARTTHLGSAARDDLRAVVTSAEREWYGPAGRESPAAPDLTPGVLAVADGLDRNAPKSIADRILPRSLRLGARD